MQSNMEQLTLSKELISHILQGHPWIYKDAIAGKLSAKSGDIVKIVDSKERFVALGLLDPFSPIAIRIISTYPENDSLHSIISKRFVSALALRKSLSLSNKTDAFRLINGEGDRLPGVIVDVYGEYAVVKLDTPAWIPHLPIISRYCSESLKPAGVIFKGFIERKSETDNPSKKHSDEDSINRVLYGKPAPKFFTVSEYGMNLGVDVYSGQKTGFFIDQRENRKLIRDISKGKRVLNLFSYTGGFSVSAALGGATQTISVDVSRGALIDAKKNMELNNIDLDSHFFEAKDCFEYLDTMMKKGEKFDLVIVDPPSFAPNQKSLYNAMRAYAKLNQKAMSVLSQDGLIATASCSSHVSMPDFTKAIDESAKLSKKIVRIIETRQEPLDHPVPIHFSQGRYLKFILATVS